MAHGHDQHDGHGAEQHLVHESHTKQYVQIFFFLLVVTAVEIVIPIFGADLGLGKVLQVVILLTLMGVKGTFVAMYYMHLKGDRRMFGSLFVFPLIVVLMMVAIFILLFQPNMW